MGKLSDYVAMSVGLMALLTLAGLPTGGSWILNQLGINIGNIQNFSSGFFMTGIITAIASLVAVTGIRIGIFGSANPTVFASAILALPFALLIGDLVSIITYAVGLNTPGNWAAYVVFLIIAPLLFKYGFALFNFAKGGDA